MLLKILRQSTCVLILALALASGIEQSYEGHSGSVYLYVKQGTHVDDLRMKMYCLSEMAL